MSQGISKEGIFLLYDIQTVSGIKKLMEDIPINEY